MAVELNLKVGDAAPDFTAKIEDGSQVSLKDFTGRKLLLYFYPKDNTSGCTAEACSLRDAYDELRERGVHILGVSPQDEKSHNKFIEKNSLNFPLIADTDNKVALAYGVWQEKSMCGRTYMGIVRVSFLIDEAGKIEHIFDKVKTKEHGQQVLAYLNK